MCQAIDHNVINSNEYFVSGQKRKTKLKSYCFKMFTSCSIIINTGAISYVNMFVFAVEANQSPAIETMSSP